MATVRKIIKIDEEKCNGCGLCADACAEGAIRIVNGKAKLVSEIYCDGLGNCIGECPLGALTIEEREAAAFDEEKTGKHVERMKAPDLPCGCPGTTVRQFQPNQEPGAPETRASSQLRQWPIQLTLVPPGAPCFRNSELLLAADCVPFAMADFHSRFLSGKSLVVGCPKLDDADFYGEKLAEILKQSDIKGITIVHMEVPCCHGLKRIADAAISASGKVIEKRTAIVAVNGEAMD